MSAILVGNWWALALRGVLAILFAIFAFILPLVAATAMVLVFAAYCFVDGVFALAAGLRAARQHGRSGPLLFEGILNLLIGVFFFLWPGAALVAFVWLIAIWAVITGALLVAAGIALIRHSGEWLLILGGIISVLLGIVLFFAPGAGIVAISWWLGIYALLFGIALLVAAFRMRRRPA
ncbi:MAG: HdeD family acid-resistance protein [Alphaproteobacteria bacterium]